MAFRKDIEILRGFSVLIVLLYHFKFDFLESNFSSSGYIGVDIFFVISGYIITKIFFEDKYSSILKFYSRRFSRLMPALVSVISVSLIVAYFIFDLFILKKNINSSISIFVGLSNFFFWLTSTIYGLAEKNSMIFLHTWSLSVEFQFYIIYPFLLFYFKDKFIKFFLVVIFFLSYISIYYLFEKHNLFNFYSSFSRIFEIVAGCLSFIFEKEIRSYFNKKYHGYLYFLGFILILFFMLILHNEDNHPNPQSLIFILGTCIMLIFYNKNLKFLLNIGLDKLGKISYSLYLLHFPIIVFLNYLVVEYNDGKKLLSLLLCFGLSYISYYSIENKFRKLNFKKNLIFLIFCLIPVIFLSLYMANKKGLYEKYIFDNFYLADESNKYLKNNSKIRLRDFKNIFSHKNDYKFFAPKFSNKNNKKILFLGDSHSKDLFNVFYSQRDYFHNYEFSRYGFNLIDMENIRLNHLLDSELFKVSDYIVLSQRYRNEDIILINNLIKIVNSKNKKLIIALKKPEFKKNNKKNQTFLDVYYQENKKANVDDLNAFAYKNLNPGNFVKINNEIKKQFSKKVKFLDIYSLICNDSNERCNVVNEKFEKNFYDYGHFTLSGSKFFGKKISESKKYNQLF